jgi:WhiB family redox-sensing transcriptional regulator
VNDPSDTEVELARYFGRQFRPEPWMAQAACRDENPDLFFPARGESTDRAKSICERCSVRKACLEYALRTEQRFGIFGGTSERERRRMRSRRNQDRVA